MAIRSIASPQLTLPHLSLCLCLSVSLSLSLSFSSTCFHLPSLLLLRPDQNGVEESQASSSQPHIWTQHAFSFLLSFFSSVRSLRSSTILSYPSFFSFAVRFLFIRHSPCSRPLSHDSSTSFGSSFLSTFRQLDAFLTTRSTHPEGTTVELYSASTTTIVSSSVRWKADKQRRCKRAAPFHFCLTSNLLQHRLMKETWSDRPWWRSEGRLEA